MIRIARSILDLIGNTPMIQINHLSQNPHVELYVKLENSIRAGASKTA
jgi:cysteine synthase